MGHKVLDYARALITIPGHLDKLTGLRWREPEIGRITALGEEFGTMDSARKVCAHMSPGFSSYWKVYAMDWLLKRVQDHSSLFDAAY